MKLTRFILSCVIVAAAVFAAVTIFSDNSVPVSVAKIKNETYLPSIYLSGTVSSVDLDTLQNIEDIEVVAPSNEMNVTVLVGESSISKIKLGQKAVITTNAFKEKEYNAVVDKIADSAKKVSLGAGKIVAVEVRLKITDADENLKSGFTAKAKIFTDEPTQVTVLPYSAVLEDDKGEYVYLCQQGRAVRRNVKTGRELENGYEVISGVGVGDIVITSPALISKNGADIYVSGEEL